MAITEKYLKKLTERETRVDYEVFDIESNSWTDFEMAGAYDGAVYTFFNTVEELGDYITHWNSRGKYFYAHFGGKFDFLFLLDYFRKNSYRFNIVQAGSKIISIKIHLNEKNRVTLVDSSAILPMSLDKLTEGFGVTRKMTGAIDFEKEKVSKNNLLHKEYLKTDCVALYEALNKFFSLEYIKKAPHKVTTSSYAMHLWRQTIKTPIRITSQDEQDFCRRSYFGGRCEIFKREAKNLNIYDVNSLYPTVMKTYPIPGEIITKSDDPLDFGFHDVTVKYPDTYLPVLPFKRDKKLIFPVGIFRGVWFSEEIKLALQEGAEILEHHQGYLFTKETDIFSEYINRFYKIRLENPGNNALNITAKLLMNGLYGKFGQREDRETLYFDENKEGKIWRNIETFQKTGLKVQKVFNRSPFQLVHIASAVTSWARIHMARNYYLPYAKNLWYTDTDSIFVNSLFQVGGTLGDLKHEGTPDFSYFRLPKAYFLQFKDHNKIKLKGFPKKALENITLSDFKNNNLKYEKIGINSLKKSLIMNKTFLSRSNFSREIKSEYDKREMLPCGDSRPWKINEWREDK